MHTVSDKKLLISDLRNVIKQNMKLELSAEARTKIINCRTYLEGKLETDSTPIYGVSTGFGSLCDTLIDKERIKDLQYNLVRSHACGMGNEIPHEIARLMMLLKIQSLSYGHSGVRLKTIERLITFYNSGVVPVIYELGSLGASGDLAPLAHLALTLIGEGEVYYENEKLSGKDLHEKLGLEPLTFEAKEGLALLNGTQFMSAYAVSLLIQAEDLYNWANCIGLLSCEAFLCKIDPFDPRVHALRPHPGQIKTAEFFFRNMSESPLQQEEKKQVQDPYSFRCIPQVHGATYDALSHVREVTEREINAVTDNPNVFPDSDAVISAGNFHGQPLALVLDYAAIALAELANISERRGYKLLNGDRGLPAFLVKHSGLNSGFMIPQYSAASAVSQNKQFCTPASVDSIVSSNGQEDHVSMGANAAVKALCVADNVRRVLGVELLIAAQALDFRRPGKSAPDAEDLYQRFREKVSFMSEDRLLYTDMKAAYDFLKNNNN